MKKILVTGAGGFIGGWIAESFAMAGIPVRAGLRRWNSAVRLARHDIDIVACDILCPRQLDEAMMDCDAVVHCAVGNEAVTVSGTRHVMQAARRAQIRRVVHLSSVAVYGKSPGVITENHARSSRRNRYAAYKIAAEQIVEQSCAEGVPAIVLRPSIVYGPFSKTWTVSFARRLMSGRWGTMGRHGEGKCNLVYVTDVVQAVHQALHAPAVAVGEAFNVNGADVLTWNDYFQQFNTALGRPPLEPVNPASMAMRAKLLAPVRTAAQWTLARFSPFVFRLHARSASAANYMKHTESLLKLTPTSEQLKLYRLDADYPIEKAQKLLGYVPRVDVDQGLTFSVNWLRQQAIVSG